MVQVDQILLSVQERDKWRHRMEILQRSLGDVREQRRRTAQRLRRIKKELSRLRATADALLDRTRTRMQAEVTGAARSSPPR